MTSQNTDTLSYHERELRVAMDRSHPSHILPPHAPHGSRILDIGCGAGQTLIASYPDIPTFGLDLDLEALRLGRQWTDNVSFVCGSAEQLPYRNAEFDFVVARVSLTYTDINRSLREIRRVMKPQGFVWMTLHPISLCWSQARKGNCKGWLFFLYVLGNGLFFHFFQKQFRLFGRQESFQTESAIRRALQHCGFQTIEVDRKRSFVVTARVP